MVLEGVTLRVGVYDVLWERTFTLVGCEMEPSGHSGAALAHRIRFVQMCLPSEYWWQTVCCGRLEIGRWSTLFHDWQEA